MKKLKLKKFKPYKKFNKMHGIIIASLVAGVGAYFIFSSFAAYGTLNTIVGDDGTCGTIFLGAGLSPPVLNSTTPSFIIYADGGAGVYDVSIDGAQLNGPGATVGGVSYPKAFEGNNKGDDCISNYGLTLSQGQHTITATELSPHSSNTVTPLTFIVDTVVPNTPSTPVPDSDNDATLVNGVYYMTRTNAYLDGTSDPGNTIIFSEVTTGKGVGGASATSGGTYSGSTTPLTPGIEYQIQAQANRDNGNQSAQSGAVNIVVGLTGTAAWVSQLSIPGVAQTAQGFTSSPSHTWTWAPSTDNGGPGLGSPAYQVEWSTDPTFNTGVSTGTSSTTSFTTPDLTGQATTWFFAVRSVDANGDVSAYSPLGTVSVDTAPPTTPGTPYISSGSNTNSPTWAWVTSHDNVVGLAATPYAIQWSQDPSFTTGVYTATSATNSLSTPGLSNGTWYMEVDATNTLGITSPFSAAGSFVVNSNPAGPPPTVSINSPASGSSVYGNGQISIHTTDTPNNSGSISGVEILVNNKPVQTLTSTPYNFSFNALPYPDGNNTITIQATDNQGDVGTASLPIVVSDGDLNNDGKVNISDLSILASNWGKTGMTYAQGDINGDSVVNIQDLAILAENWGDTGL